MEWKNKVDAVRHSQKQPAKTDFALKQRCFIKSRTIRFKKQREGFVLIILLPLMMALMAGFSGLILMSLGIKNLTQAQSLCITENIHGQKKLGKLLTRLLKFNQTVIRLQHTKRALQTTLAGAIALGQVQVVSALRKQLSLIKKYQQYISHQQKYILMQSELIRKTVFQNLKTNLKVLEIKNIQEKKVFKKALAVSKKTLGPDTHIYQLLPDFTKQQAVVFLWEINPFLKNRLYKLFPFYQQKTSYIKRQCAATLKKQGNQWKAQLTH